MSCYILALRSPPEAALTIASQIPSPIRYVSRANREMFPTRRLVADTTRRTNRRSGYCIRMDNRWGERAEQQYKQHTEATNFIH